LYELCLLPLKLGDDLPNSKINFIFDKYYNIPIPATVIGDDTA